MPVPFSPKVAALIIRCSEETCELLVHGFEHDPGLPLRFPGGGVDDGESLEQAVSRELLEEAGIGDAKVIRRLGVVRFYKTYSKSFLERHDFLMKVDRQLPDEWGHQVKGDGRDSGEIFSFRWIRSDEFHLIDIELQKFLDHMHIPELFADNKPR